MLNSLPWWGNAAHGCLQLRKLGLNFCLLLHTFPSLYITLHTYFSKYIAQSSAPLLSGHNVHGHDMSDFQNFKIQISKCLLHNTVLRELRFLWSTPENVGFLPEARMLQYWSFGDIGMRDKTCLLVMLHTSKWQAWLGNVNVSVNLHAESKKLSSREQDLNLRVAAHQWQHG